MPLPQNLPKSVTEYTDQLFFGIFSQTPHSDVSVFLTRYVPTLLKKPQTEGTWTAYPLNYIEEATFQMVTNGYVFYKHPYFELPFKSGQLAITQKIYAEERWIENIQDIKLWFDFDNEEDAKKAFNKLVTFFSGLDTTPKITCNNGVDYAVFADKNESKYYSCIQLRMAKDNFTIGNYRLLFEIVEDMDE